MAKKRHRKRDKLSAWENLLIRFNLASRQLKIAQGGILYRELGRGLPVAKGDAEADKDRLTLFVKAAKRQPAYKVACLKEWLEHELSYTNDTFRFLSGREEERERKWAQVIKEHLDALEKMNV